MSAVYGLASMDVIAHSSGAFINSWRLFLPRQLQPVRSCTRCGSETNEFYKCSKVSDGLSSWCKPCFKTHRSDLYQSNPELKAKRYAQIADWKRARPELSLAQTKRYQKANPEKIRAQGAKSRKRHYARVLAKNAKRRAQKLGATPTWANKFFIEEIYDLAQRRTKCLGRKYVVDHVIPLIHPLVCGLHVETNLQVMTQTENARKHNSYSIT